MPRKFVQLFLLLWKNYILHRRKWIVTIFEVIIPTLLCIVLILIRQRVSSKDVPLPVTWANFTVDDLPASLNGKVCAEMNIAYAPQNNFTDSVMDLMELEYIERKIRFPDEDAVVRFLSDKDNKCSLAGVVFDMGNNFPATVTYKLRFPYKLRASSDQSSSMNPFDNTNSWLTQFIYPVIQKVGPREWGDRFGGGPGYYREGFLALQHSVSRALLQHMVPSLTVDFNMFLRRIPYPPFLDDTFVLVIQKQLPLLVMLSFLFSSLNIVKNIVYEKEKRLKEAMKMLGISDCIYWASWFFTYLLLFIITVALMTLMMTVWIPPLGKVISFSDPGVIFVFFLVYAMSLIAFSFAVGAFFSSANSGAAASGILFFCSYIPYFFIQPRYQNMSSWAKLATCLIPNVGMALGGQLIGMFEGAEAGVQWSTLNNGVSVDDNFTMLMVMGMLLFDTLFYLIVAWYVEHIFPGKYGVPHPWYFPVQICYWCCSRPDVETTDLSETSPLLDQKPARASADSSRHRRQFSATLPGAAPDATPEEFFEAEPLSLRPGIQIRNLKKVYGHGAKSKLAISNMTLNMYKGQITVLLGHNGAGKTTTISVLTGFTPPTRGTALVSGYDIRRDIQGVRQSLGFCPQHDILFDQMTVYEHLRFFAKLKGCEPDEISREVDEMLARICLESKRNTQSAKLSGGMRRRLSVGLALIGGSQVVILDEPTSGLDPDARRQVWNILQKERPHRTFLLTTHFMDEADILGDRIAIMASGVVQCCGSPLFLKAKYGAGYRMSLVKTPNCCVSDVVGLVMAHVPGARVQSNVSEELALILPSESVPQFELLFTQIEERKEELGIQSYGASVTTMEEVFLKVGDYQEELGAIHEEKRERYGSFSGLSDSNLSSLSVNSDVSDLSDGTTPSASSRDTRSEFLDTHNSGWVLFWQQFAALLLKRLRQSLRRPLISICQVAVPILFTAIGLAVVRTMPGEVDSPPLLLSLDSYGDTVITYLAHNLSHTGKAAMNGYVRQFDGQKNRVIFVNDQPGYTDDLDYERYLIDQAKKDIFTFNQRYIIGAEFAESDSVLHLTAYFNNQPYHSPGLALNALTNGLLQYANTNLRINVVNHPLPRTFEDTIEQETFELTGFTVAINLLFGMSFLAGSLTLGLIRERAVKAKHLQFVSGVNLGSYWLSTFLWDMVNYLIPAASVLIVLAGFNVTAYVGDGRIWDVSLLLILYGWAVIPLMYLMSSLFSIPSTGLVWLTLFNIFSGVATLLAVNILSIPELGLQQLGNSLAWIFLVFLPNYGLGQAMVDFNSNNAFIKACDNDLVRILCQSNVSLPCCPKTCGNFCAYWNTNYLGWAPSGIGRMITFLSAQGLIYFLIVFFLDSSTFTRLWFYLSPERRSAKLLAMEQEREPNQHNARLREEDDDVSKHRSYITSRTVDQLTRENCLVLREVTKVYSSGLRAVNQASWAVHPGECFGLLGVNGAGKTTTFRMLTGDLTPTIGDLFVNGFRVTDQLHKAQQTLGYCPQFDALLDHLTGRETLVLFARLRGVPECHISGEVNSLLANLTLIPHADKLVGQYSGGNKRKLSTAVALVGCPPLVCLDEPTTGMDPMARRHLWNVLSKYRDAGHTLVLTSHSMEECEALCTRVGIMVNGELKCLGGCQHLKGRFGRGYTLLAQIQRVDTEPDQEIDKLLGATGSGGDLVDGFIRFIEEEFPEAELIDRQEGLVHYHLHPTPTVTWARVFGLMERNKTRLSLVNYLVSQTTLEQVFLGFARTQRPPQQEEPSSSCWHLCTSCVSCRSTSPLVTLEEHSTIAAGNPRI